jgi:hypothetical protein
MKKQTNIALANDVLLTKIYFIREQKVMLDRDLAELYDVETKYLKRQVMRNKERFPDDFMFTLTKNELLNWRSQFGTSNSEKKGLRYLPYAFTEQGLSMLSGVLNSDRAIHVNIKIMRVFTQLRQMLTDITELKLRLEELKNKTANNTKNIEP